MGTRTYAVTNDRVNEVVYIIDELIRWADDDALHAREHDAHHIAMDDNLRSERLRQARDLMISCKRED